MARVLAQSAHKMQYGTLGLARGPQRLLVCARKARLVCFRFNSHPLCPRVHTPEMHPSIRDARACLASRLLSKVWASAVLSRLASLKLCLLCPLKPSLCTKSGPIGWHLLNTTRLPKIRFGLLRLTCAGSAFELSLQMDSMLQVSTAKLGRLEGRSPFFAALSLILVQRAVFLWTGMC